uniref:Energy-coupling factor ABC transporter permease n=1 Tax=Eiseniibacteriota bacterium TaxID=2212470 RepID=A0A832I3L0_UNCEI
MSHLHIPDGVLPPPLWGGGLALALALLAASSAAARRGAPARAGVQGALGALMLAVMSIPIPPFALEYCLTLAGPVGVLLGPAAAFQTVFVVSVILALLGQGGMTVVGLNALVLGAGAAVARPLFRQLTRWLAPPAALAGATALGQLASGALWFAVLAAAFGADPSRPIPAGGPDGHGHGARLTLFAGLTFMLWAVAVFAEAGIAYGVGRFLARVRPDLLPPAVGRDAQAAGPRREGSP